MTGFTVGDKLVATPGLSEEQIAQIEKEQKQEQQLLTEVTEETFSPIERTPEQDSAISAVKNAIDLKQTIRHSATYRFIHLHKRPISHNAPRFLLKKFHKSRTRILLNSRHIRNLTCSRQRLAFTIT